MHGFSFRIFEDKIEVQDVISPRSLDQILISSIPWMRKRVKNAKKSNDTQIVVSRQFDFLENLRGSLLFAKNIVFIEQKRHNR